MSARASIDAAAGIDLGLPVERKMNCALRSGWCEPLDLAAHEACLLQHLEVLRDGTLGQRKHFHDLSAMQVPRSASTRRISSRTGWPSALRRVASGERVANWSSVRSMFIVCRRKAPQLLSSSRAVVIRAATGARQDGAEAHTR